MHRRTPSPELVSTAHHEAGHAVAISAVFRDAAWLPYPPPPVRVRSVEVVESTPPGQWTGSCVGTNIYSTSWKRVSERFRDLMEAQVIVELAGGIAEAIHRGERRKQEVLAFATRQCSIDVDLQRAADVLGDLRRLTGYRLDAQHFADRTLTMLEAHWPAVATALIEDRRIEGERVERIIDHSIERASS